MDQRHRIVQIVRSVSGKDVTPAPDESLFESGILDSFVLTELVAELERQFDIRIPDSDLSPRKFETIDRIAGYIEGR